MDKRGEKVAARAVRSSVVASVREELQGAGACCKDSRCYGTKARTTANVKGYLQL
jgi:hypothetical protein